MHKEILSEEQKNIFPNLKIFSADFSLVGGTAIAFHLGHRQSIDFDLASAKPVNAFSVRKRVLEFGKIETVILDNADEYSLVVNGIKFTFFNYPFLIEFSEPVDDIIPVPDIYTLAAMKAYALGRRAKWKDYVDLYFIANKAGSLDPIIEKAKKIFGKEFSEKNFRVQLSYFDDIDYSEKVIFMKGCEVNDEEIKNKLIEYSV
jgi:hypothetical protein